VSRYSSATRASDTALLLLAEPRLEGADSLQGQRLASMVESAKTTLLVLPKWRGREDPKAPGWIVSAEPVPEEVVRHALRAASVEAEVVRPGVAGTGTCSGSSVPLAWARPQLLRPKSDAFRALISCPGGILLGEVVKPEGPRVLVLSDPHPISNHGLGQGDNARLALEIVAYPRAKGQAIVVDETLHGHERIPSLWRELFAFPLLPSVLQATLALLALIASGMGRFGAPLPRPPALASGKSTLIENTASLLRSAGHSAHTLGRYLDAAMSEVARALHAPSFARPEELRAWLRAASRRRGASVELPALAAAVERTREREGRRSESMVALARRIHRWKQEMLRGQQDHPGR
jgi:Domain of unknown function (DUF4350)